MRVTAMLDCRQCERSTNQVIDREDDHVAETVCTACGERYWWPAEAPALDTPGRRELQADRWTRYLARQIGRLQGYGPCSIEEHSIALEIAARKAMAGPMPAAVEGQLREALDRVAEAWIVRELEREVDAHGSR